MTGELDRDAVVRAAVALADAGGTEAVTMAAVARHLGPYTPMALYRYVASKDGLIDLALDHVTGEIELPPAPTGDWRQDLTTVAVATWAMVERHPWFAEWAPARPPLGPNALRRTELLLTILTGQGATVQDAMAYAAVLDVHIVGSARQAVEEARMRRRYGLAGPAELTAVIRSVRSLVTADRYPRLAAWMADPAPADAAQQFHLSLAFLLDGIADRLARTAH